MKDNRRFQRGSGVYTCGDCGKQTRDTGHGEADTGLCYRCMQNAEIENFVSDNDDNELREIKANHPEMDWVDVYNLMDEIAKEAK